MKMMTKCQVLVLGVVMMGCGASPLDKSKKAANPTDTTSAPATNSIVSDLSLNQESATVSLSDAVETLSDSDSSSKSGSTLQLASFDLAVINKDSSSYSHTCAVSGNDALVSIKASIDREHSLSNLRRTAQWSLTGSEDIERDWSKSVNNAAVPVLCTADNKYAAIDWSADTTGLALSVKIDRSRDESGSFSFKKLGTSGSNSRKFEATGTRSVKWLSQTSDATAKTITREKQVSSDVTRTHHAENSAGKMEDMTFEVKTDDSAPLAIETVRSSADLSLISHTIKSGSLISTRSGDGKTIATFNMFAANFSGNVCSLVSGTVTYQLFKEGEDKASKNYQLVIKDGDYTLTDTDTNTVVVGFDFEGCDIGDFSN